MNRTRPNGTAPTHAGAAHRQPLYRLRAPAKVTLTLDWGKTRIKRLDTPTARAERLAHLRPARLGREPQARDYSVHLVARSTDGKTTRTA